MAADVLTYNALNEVYKANREKLAVGLSSIAVQNDLCQYAVNLKQTNCDDLRQASSVRHPELWGLIPTQPNNGSTFNNGLKVCNTDATFGCGCNCTCIALLWCMGLRSPVMKANATQHHDARLVPASMSSSLIRSRSERRA